MKKKEAQYSDLVECGYCNNKSMMLIIATCDNIEATGDDEELGGMWQAGSVWQVLKCLACKEITIRTYDYHEGMEDDKISPSYTTLYPSTETELQHLPPLISKSYEDALRISSIDPNAYAVLLGRVIDKVCIDKGAEGGSLYDRLKNLADQEIIPKQLAEMANQLRHLRNIGAHADLGELTSNEIPILRDLCRAILEYVYRGPMLIKQVQNRLTALKKTKQ